MTPPQLHRTSPDAIITDDQVVDERLTTLERRARQSRRDVRELRRMLSVTCGKVDMLCDTLRPVIEWASVQISEEKKDAASWRDTWRGAKKEAWLFLLKAGFVLAASALGIGWLTGMGG